MTIKNNSNEPIINVDFTTSEALEVIKIDKIEPNQRVTEFLSMRNNQGDGAYILTFTRANGKKETSANGYFSNGGSLNYLIDYIVENDTTIVNFDDPIY